MTQLAFWSLRKVKKQNIKTALDRPLGAMAITPESGFIILFREIRKWINK